MGAAAEPRDSERRPDEEAGVLADLEAPSPLLAVAFGGMMMRVDGIPPFEFFRMFGSLPVKKLFLRDHRQAYYHRGVRGLGDDLDAVAAGIRAVAEHAGAHRVAMLGSSGGGYAALLFGRLLGVEVVHAFAPTTFIRADLRERHGDHRFEGRWAALMGSGAYQPRYGDLRALFRETPAAGTRFVIHYCATHELDHAHAARLAAEPGVELRAYEQGDHSVVRHLRETGELERLLRGLAAG